MITWTNVANNEFVKTKLFRKIVTTKVNLEIFIESKNTFNPIDDPIDFGMYPIEA